MPNTTGLVWYTMTDLRVDDHEPLIQANKIHSHVTNLFVFDTNRWFAKSTTSKLPRTGPYRARFLLESIAELRRNLRSRGSTLILRCGPVSQVVCQVAKQIKAGAVYKHVEVCTEELEDERNVKRELKNANIELKTFWGAQTMYHLNDLPFQDVKSELPATFTDFKRRIEGRKCRVRDCMEAPMRLKPCVVPQGVVDGGAANKFPLADCVIPEAANQGEGVIPSLKTLGVGSNLNQLYSALGLSIRDKEDASSDALLIGDEDVLEGKAFNAQDPRSVLAFRGGETSGMQRITDYFADESLAQTYKETRNGLLGADFSTKFSPWLAFGNVSPRRIVSELESYETRVVSNESTRWIVFELLWRDYFHLYAVKHGKHLFLPGGPRRIPSAMQSWSGDADRRNAWCLGTTGFPFVDANMRELLQSGFMSNRGRQCVASFFVNDLALDWRVGAEIFEYLLIDHDPGSNYGNWTYLAGVGADPRQDRYFLIPKQTKTYDAQGLYVKTWVKELSKSAANDFHVDPNVVIGRFPKEYPAPIVRMMTQQKPHPQQHQQQRVERSSESSSSYKFKSGKR